MYVLFYQFSDSAVHPAPWCGGLSCVAHLMTFELNESGKKERQEGRNKGRKEGEAETKVGRKGGKREGWTWKGRKGKGGWRLVKRIQELN